MDALQTNAVWNVLSDPSFRFSDKVWVSYEAGAHAASLTSPSPKMSSVQFHTAFTELHWTLSYLTLLSLFIRFLEASLTQAFFLSLVLAENKHWRP